MTFGYLAGEIFRPRSDGRTIGTALREDIAEPLGLDLWIGLPDAEHARVADVRRPPAMPDLGPITEPKRLAFLTKWATPGGVSAAEWRRAEIPSANGHATAPALARLMASLAGDGVLGAERLLSPGLAAEASRQRIAGPGPGAALRDELGRGVHPQPGPRHLRPRRGGVRPLRLGRQLRLRRPRARRLRRLCDEPPVGAS